MPLVIQSKISLYQAIIKLMLIKRQLQARITSAFFILDKSSGNKVFLRLLEEYNGVCLKKFGRIEQKLDN